MKNKAEEKLADFEIPFDLSLLLNKNKLVASIEKQVNLNLNYKKDNTQIL